MDNLHSSFDSYIDHVPTENEIDSIKGKVIEPCTQRLKALDDEMESFKAKLRVLERERETILLRIERHRALISPICRLPRDILGEIFTRCLPTEHFALMKATEAPLLLCRICSAWRQIAMSTPRLWSSIHIPYANEPTRATSGRESFEGSWKARIANISSWLSRSGSLPLSISCYISYHTVIDRNQSSLLANLMAALIDFKRRWRRLYVVNQDVCADIGALLSDLTADDLPMLESFSIANPPDYASDVFPLGILKARHLQHLGIQPLSAKVVDLPHDQLATFSASFNSWGGEDIFQHFPNIITGSHNLVELKLVMEERCSEFNSLPFQVSPAVLPRLRRLELRIERRGFLLLPIFQNLPVLKHLKVTFDIEEFGDDGLVGAFMKGLPPLESLHLAYSCLSVDEIVEALQSQVELKCLTLRNMIDRQRSHRRNSELLMTRLTEKTRTQPMILPSLESFTHIDPIIKDRYYKEFLLLRTGTFDLGAQISDSANTTTLKYANINFQRFRVVDLLSDSELQAACAASGLQLNIQYPSPYVPPFQSHLGIPNDGETPFCEEFQGLVDDHCYHWLIRNWTADGDADSEVEADA